MSLSAMLDKSATLLAAAVYLCLRNLHAFYKPNYKYGKDTTCIRNNIVLIFIFPFIKKITSTQ